jgi:hypothetical protein
MLASLPVALVIYYQAECMTFGSEAVAYRFFYSYRILNGERGNLFFPQGYLLSAAQHLVLLAIGGHKADANSLRWALNQFSIATLVLNTAVLVAAATVVSLVRGITWSDRFVLAGVGLGPMYATSGQGFQHSLWPDYYHLDVALNALGLALCQVVWRRSDLGRSWSWALAAGGFVGMATANKITAAVCGLGLVILLVFRSGNRLTGVISRSCLVAIGTVAGCAMPVLAFYGFDIGAAQQAFPSWLAFLRNPGGDAGFYSEISRYLVGNHLGLFVALYLVSLGMLAFDLARNSDWQRGMLLAAMLALGAILLYSVLRRPAGTSIFEAAVFLGGFGGLMLTVLRSSRLRTAIVTAFCTATLIAAVGYFPWRSAIHQVAASRQEARIRWDVFNYAKTKAAGRPLVFFIPNNSYHAQDVFIVLLKGSAEPFGWAMSGHGRALLDRFAPGLEFRFVGQPAPGPHYRDAVYAWNDAAGRKPVQAFFPELRDALSRPGVRVEAFDLRTGERFSQLDVNEPAP